MAFKRTAPIYDPILTDDLFKRASDYVGTRIYDEPLSLLTGNIERGSLVLLYGHSCGNRLAHRLCFASQLPFSEEGLASAGIVVDAGGSFDPYHISDLAARKGLDPRKVLDRLVISRAFNCHQLMELVCGRLAGEIRERRAGVVCVLDPCLADSELRPSVQSSMAERLSETLYDLAYRYLAVVVVTIPSKDDYQFTRRFLKNSDIAVRFGESRFEGAAVKATLLRHPCSSRLGRAIYLNEEGGFAGYG